MVVVFVSVIVVVSVVVILLWVGSEVQPPHESLQIYRSNDNLRLRKKVLKLVFQ